MSVDGVWKVEMMGPYGWEKISTAFLKGGRFLAASADHYSTGSYEVDGGTLTAAIQITQHGKVRAIFGAKKKRLSTQFEAKIKKEDKMVGKSRPADGKKFEVKMRLTRLADLD